MNLYGVNSEYDKKFNSEVPKKQAKSYEIDLGQNNGPYKEDLLIRYGDNTLHQIIKENINENMDMEDVMHMNDVLKPFQERAGASEENNLNDQCMVIENDFGYIDDDTKKLKDLEEGVNKLIELTTNDIFKMFDDTYNEFNPELLEKYKFLKTQIKDQKDENANLFKQIDLLNQEISSIFENIIKLGGRLEGVEKVCGVDKVSYEEDFNNDDDDN